MSAICCIDALACCAEVPRSCSTLERSDWMPLVVTLSCCASACAAPSATVCARAGRQCLQRGGELVQRGFERTAVAGRAIDTLKLLQDVGHLVGVTAAAGLGAQLVQHVAVELPADAGRHRRRAEVAGGDLDLVRRLDDVTRRLRVGDVRGDDRERGLVGTQTAHRTGEG
jgi:hypothetical protein